VDISNFTRLCHTLAREIKSTSTFKKSGAKIVATEFGSTFFKG